MRRLLLLPCLLSALVAACGPGCGGDCKTNQKLCEAENKCHWNGDFCVEVGAGLTESQNALDLAGVDKVSRIGSAVDKCHQMGTITFRGDNGRGYISRPKCE